MRTSSRQLTVRLCAAAVLLCVARQTSPQQNPAVATFRSTTSLVPVDIRVVDASGRPIAGIEAKDFAVREDGQVQTLRHFAEYSLAPDAPSGDGPPILGPTAGDALKPQKARVFLFVLGRGRLREPSKAIDALLSFVREGLLPQDQAAVLAWNRATNFTTDHQTIGRTIERFNSEHEGIEASLAMFEAGRMVYGSRQPTPAIQQKIDSVFSGDDPATPTTGVMSSRAIASPPDDLGRRELGRYGVTFEQFVRDSMQRDQDLGNLYTGIEYPRHLDGEKHLVFLTQGGIVLDRLEDDLSLAALANDARVALDTLQTGGLAGAPAATVWGFSPSLMTQVEQIAKDLGKPNVREELAFQTLKNLSRLTGGVSSVAALAGPAFTRLDRVTRSGYQLGYYPTNRSWDGKYRRIEVTVNRPGATVMFRHGYFARDVTAPLDRRSFVTFNRIAVAGSYDRELGDLKIGVKVLNAEGQGGVGTVAAVDITIDLSRVTFAVDGDRHVASLDINVFCGDDKEKAIGESWQRAELRLQDATYERLVRSGYVHHARVSLKGRPRYVKAVVYDYASDLVGSAMSVWK